MIAGVAGGFGEFSGVPSSLVRLGLVVLCVAGGLGLVLYGAAWLLVPVATPEPEGGPGGIDGGGRRSEIGGDGLTPLLGAAAILLGTLILLRAAGLFVADAILWPVALAAGGLILIWSRSAQEVPDSQEIADQQWLARLPPAAREAAAALVGTRRGTQVRVAIGAVFVVVGVAAFLAASGGFESLWRSSLAVLAIGLGVLLVLGPWLWRLSHELASERRERIRSQERADMAAHLHDSVLQTLAMVQRRADDPHEVVRLARRQERELRSWLAGTEARRDTTTVGAALDQVASEVENDSGVPIELVKVGDAELTDAGRALVAAGAEAIRNAVRHSGAASVSVFLECSDGRAGVFVRDRGCGFEPEEVPGDRRGISESIENRMARHGGSAEIRSSVGEGTEVDLSMPLNVPLRSGEETQR